MEIDGSPQAKTSDWSQMPLAKFAWSEDSYLGCTDVKSGEVIRVLRHDKCCDVVLVDSITGKTSRPCDDEPWRISINE